MDIEFKENNGWKFAEIEADGTLLSDLDSALDIIGECFSQRADAVFLRRENIAAEFFDLRTRIAGEIFQKFTQYGLRLAIIGDFAQERSKSLRDFIRESNGRGWIVFSASPEEALALLK